MSENITIHEIGYILDGINHVLKLPGYVDMGMTKEYAEAHPQELHDVTMVKVLDWINKNCEIRLKSIKKRNGTNKNCEIRLKSIKKRNGTKKKEKK